MPIAWIGMPYFSASDTRTPPFAVPSSLVMTIPVTPTIWRKISAWAWAFWPVVASSTSGTECGYVLYDNPKIVVGTVARWGERILLVRRSIEPRYGYWTLPAGYLELNESASAGAEREAWEEARARIEIEGLLAVYDIPRISQIQLIYRARLLDEAIAAGPESLEVGLFRWEEIPWDRLAFPSIRWALQHDREARATQDFTARINPPGF